MRFRIHGITVLIATTISNGGKDVRFHIYECFVCEQEKDCVLVYPKFSTIKSNENPKTVAC